MKIATWNVNSIRKRLPVLLDWLERHQPHVLCLQETKSPDNAWRQSEQVDEQSSPRLISKCD